MWFTGETWQPSPVAPGTVEDGVGAALVVRAVRLAAGLGCWALVEGVFRDACCAGGGIAASRLFLILLQGLALGARRPLRLGFIGAPELTHDERALLQMVAAAQRGDTALLEASAAWLAGPASAASVARAAAGLADLLALNGALLPALPAQAVQRPLSARIAALGS